MKNSTNNYASDEQLEASTHSKIQRIRGDRLDADAWRHMQSQLALLEALNGADAIAWLQDTLRISGRIVPAD